MCAVCTCSVQYCFQPRGQMITADWFLPEVVPSLLVCLRSGVCEVRKASIAVLHSFRGVVSSPYHPLVEHLLKSSEEIIADPSYLSQVSHSRILTSLWVEFIISVPCAFGKEMTLLSFLQSLSMVYEEAILLKGKSKKLASIDQLLQCVQLPCCPLYTSKSLLRAIQDIHGEVR